MGHKPKPYNNKYVVTESEVFTGKISNRDLAVLLSDSEINTVRPRATVKDILTKIVTFCPEHPKRDQNP